MKITKGLSFTNQGNEKENKVSHTHARADTHIPAHAAPASWKTHSVTYKQIHASDCLLLPYFPLLPERT